VIRRLLIANRGEIAVRIMQTCRELGIETVAVFSESDHNALHAVLANQAVPIGASPALQSYLNIPKVIEAARSSGADAIHPGYGFLSQSPAFAAACADAGLIFVGPPADVMSRMGSKIEARQLMESAGVPVVPGGVPSDQSDAALARAIEEVGFPALIKPSKGGGGKGMRIVEAAADVVARLQAARREAQAAFGDGTLYVERVVSRPHHIEVQVIADQRGNTLHLFERECSVQRRHQKVIEESPSPNVTPALRQRLTTSAILAAQASSYRNAGTVEFLVDLTGQSRDNAPFHFLEMNTRLQVEHGVTEQVVGVDLVRAQLQVASGEPLAWPQRELNQRGHAIEARVYAEDPEHGFLPQAGRLLLYHEPRMPGVRVDSGVREGDEISVHYDPLLAKVIAYAETRELAIARLLAALRAFPVLGIITNIPFLIRVLEHPSFRSGEMHTGFLDNEGATLAASAPEAIPDFVTAAMNASGRVGPGAAFAPGASAPGEAGHSSADWDPWTRLPGWRA
jgi:3-methylcrotonyl-CoA carboxylase alpha subunit